MEFKELEITNFLSHAHTFMAMPEKVHLISGPNGSGKSAIANAIEMVMTGRCRGVRFKKDLKEQVGQDGKAFTIRLASPVNEWIRTTVGPAGFRFPWPDDLLTVLTNHRLLASMGADGRQNLFRQVLGAPAELTIAAVLKKVKAKRVDAAGFDAVLQMPAGQIDAAESAAVQRRREIKRGLAELELTAQTHTGTAEIDGNAYDLTTKDLVKIDEQLAKLKASLRRDMQSRCDDDPDALAAQIADGDAQIEASEAEWQEVSAELARVTEPIAKLQQATTASLTARDLQSKVTALRGQLSRLIEMLEARKVNKQGEESGGKCVLSTPEHEIACGMSGDVIRTVCRDLEGQIKAALKKANAAKAAGEKAAAELTAAKAEADRLRLRGQELRGQITKLKENRPNIEQAILKARQWATARARVETTETRIATGDALRNAVSVYQQSLRLAEGAAARTAQLKADLAAWDALAHLLGKGGPVREHLASAVGAAAIDAELQERWACQVKAEADGAVTWNGRAIELISESEQWRASMLVADLLARTSGAGFIVLDQLDILAGEVRKPIVAWLNRHKANGYETIILLAASDQRPAHAATPDWLVKWWIEDGRVERIEEVREAVA